MKSKLHKKIIKVAGYILLFFLLTSLGAIMVFKYVPVRYTPLMALRRYEHRKDTSYHTQKEWKPLSEIGYEMAMAAMAAEDLRFNNHHGFDREAIRLAWIDYKKGISKRGASSITQQTAKNVFLLPHRSWLRKGMEAYFTVGIEWIWGKERILEAYLNVVETGLGIFGVEAAAQHYYQKPAKELNRREAALLASCFPVPHQRNPLYPTQNMEKRVATIEWVLSWLPTPAWLSKTE